MDIIYYGRPGQVEKTAGRVDGYFVYADEPLAGINQVDDFAVGVGACPLPSIHEIGKGAKI